ncbi:GAF and ANTAR domain-containing protein [uncultured Arthrobacter sp.]|uniref:GAF and ANTAR domain-containing protein n=1 Tax=uncultured Arthrobacter sp. TaxID=114050 RepID=UPI0028D73AC5|nr:GAF and ANTAR domain-containing protein [uncultured Arthrobacter sp.]
MTRKHPVAGELPEIFARVTGLLLTAPAVGQAVANIAQAAHESLAGSVGAGATLFDDQGRPSSTASTNSLVKQADQLQYDLGEGPCLTAWASAQAVVVDDLRREHRWQEWARAAAPLGMLSCISVPLLLPDATGNGTSEAIGALKVYADRAHAFDLHSQQVLALLAQPAALILSNIQTRERAAQLSESLKDALHSRSLIDMAKGALMERLQVNEREAMQAMISRARTENLLLSELAKGIIAPAMDLDPQAP